MTRAWNESCSALDARLDEDHRSLFSLLDRVAAYRKDSDLADINLLLDQLLEHSFDHFAREEKAMETRGFPHSEQHARDHQALRKAFIEALRRVTKGTMTLPVFIRQIKESFSYHFEVEDMAFIRWQQEQQGPGRHSGS
jgi:hemerythrin-like metal-binding protein